MQAASELTVDSPRATGVTPSILQAQGSRTNSHFVVQGVGVSATTSVASCNSYFVTFKTSRGRKFWPPSVYRFYCVHLDGQPPRPHSLLHEIPYVIETCRNDEALAQLMEVVRLSPNAAEAYHTIGTIYEAKGNPRRALDFYMIAAHLPPRVRHPHTGRLG